MRVLVLFSSLAALALAGCDMVATRTPLVTANKAGPSVRDGVWLTDPKPDCRFDRAKPVSTWPGCADALIVKGRVLHDTRKGRRPDAATIAISPGDPMLVQARLHITGGTAFYYMAVVPTAFDLDRRMVGFRAWPVLCGPKRTSPNTPPSRAFPGLRRLSDGTGCTTRSLEFVRSAARASRAFADVTAARWVRDGAR